MFGNDRSVDKLVHRAESAASGETDLTVRAIRDDYWGSSRLTKRDRKKIDDELRDAGASCTPPLASGAGLDELVRITHHEKRKAYQRLLDQRAKDKRTGSEIAAEIGRSSDNLVSLTRGQLAQRFGRPGAAKLSSEDQRSIVTALSEARVISEPKLGSGTTWPENSTVELTLPRAFKLGDTGKKILAGVVGLLVLVIVIGAIAGGGRESQPATQEEAAVESTQSDGGAPPPPTTTEAGPTRADVSAAAEDGDYDQAALLATQIGDDELRERYQRRAALVLIRKARRSLSSGRYITASRQAKRASDQYGSAAREAPSIRTAALAARKTQVAARRQAEEDRAVRAAAARAQRAADRRATQAAQDAADAAAAEPDFSEPDSSSSSSDGGVSSGGKPGCNPATARDGDGDGIVCEP